MSSYSFSLAEHHTQLQKQARAVLKPNEGPLGQDDQFSYQSPAFQLDTDFNPLVDKSQTLTKISNQSATLESKHRRGPYQTYRSHKESAYRHFANTKRQHGRGAKSLNNSNNIQHLSINSNEIIKIEKVGDDDTQSDSLTDDLYESESQMNAVSQTLPSKSSQFDAPREFTSQSETFPPSNQHVDEEYSLTSATDNSIQNAAAVHSELDPNVMVKLEPVTDSNELEIIGMESSQLAQGGEDWVPNVQTRMRYGATPADATDGSSTGNLQQYSK